MKYWPVFIIVSAVVGIVFASFSGGFSAPVATSTPVVNQVDAKISEKPSVAVRAVESNVATHYLFDVHDHSAAEVHELLNRARDTYDNLPPELRDGVKVAIVLHGPDVTFFATENYAKYKNLVELAASLDAFGFVDLKVCAASAQNTGIELTRFPAFIELVPYGPAEVLRLRGEGYVDL
jgi:intracellular sulfur oxidation DsrE/DsrF family protein